MKTLDIIVVSLLIAAGLNWGLVGVFEIDVVETVFGEMSPFSRVIYTILGLAAIYDVVMIKQIWKRWDVHFREPAHV